MDRMKVYIVFQRLPLALPGEANIKVVGCKLNSTAAQALVDDLPGTYIQKVYANKLPYLTPLFRPLQPTDDRSTRD